MSGVAVVQSDVAGAPETPAVVAPSRPCRRCCRPFVPPSNNPKMAFCGKTCRQAAWRQRHRDDAQPGTTAQRRAKFRRAWLFKADAKERIAAILAAEPPGVVVHACCGESRLPREDVRVDLYHPSATLKCDVADLAQHVRDAAVVVMDPPYGLPLPQRQRMIAACLRALRPGGLFVLHAPWWPRFRGAQLEISELHGPFLREDFSMGWPHPPVIISCWRKRSRGGRNDVARAPATSPDGTCRSRTWTDGSPLYHGKPRTICPVCGVKCCDGCWGDLDRNSSCGACRRQSANAPGGT